MDFLNPGTQEQDWAIIQEFDSLTTVHAIKLAFSITDSRYLITGVVTLILMGPGIPPILYFTYIFQN